MWIDADDVQAQWTVAHFGDSVSSPDPEVPQVAVLTWGQRALWMAIQRRGSTRNMISLRRTMAMPRKAPADVPSVVKAISALIGRHSSLRTRLDLTSEQPHQIVAARGDLPILLVDASDDTAPAIAAATAEQLAATPFDHASEWPQRVALILINGQVHWIVVVFSHTTVDFQAAEIVLRDLRLLLLRGSIPTPAGLQSTDIAQREQGVDHRRSARAVAYWLDSYRRLPADTLRRTGPPMTPRFWRAILISEAADTAVRLVARNHQVTSTTVWTAAVATVFAAWSGTDICGICTMTGNRALDGYGQAIAKLNQIGLIVIDLTRRPSLAELLPQVGQASLNAYRHAYYDPGELQQAFDAAGHPYNASLNPHCYFNDIRLATDIDLFGRATSEAEVRQALSRSSLQWAERFGEFTWRTRIEIIDMPGAAGIALTADTSYLPPEAMQRFLHDIERILVEAAILN